MIDARARAMRGRTLLGPDAAPTLPPARSGIWRTVSPARRSLSWFVWLCTRSFIDLLFTWIRLGWDALVILCSMRDYRDGLRQVICGERKGEQNGAKTTVMIVSNIEQPSNLL